MHMKQLECKCGGTLRKEGYQYVCENCDSIYLISSDDNGELFAYQPVEKKLIQTGQIGVKAATIAVKEVVVRQIRLAADIEGQVAQECVDLDTRSRIGLIEGYLSTGDWEKVDEHVNGLLLENKDCSEAKWYGWMSQKRASDDQQMLARLTDFSQADGVRLDQLLENATPAFARRIVNLFFDDAFFNDTMCYHALSVILPYARNEAINSEKDFSQRVSNAFDRVIDRTYEKAFNYLLENTLHPEDVDAYISYMTRFADHCDAKTSLMYYGRILAVDPGNLEIHRKLVRADIESDAACQKTISDVERLVSYSDETDRDITALIDQLCSRNQTSENQSDVIWGFLGYHSTAPEGVKDQLLAYGHVLLKSKLWRRARDFFNLVLSFDRRCGEAYWGLCLVQMEARTPQDAIGKKEPIKSFSAYDKALAAFRAAGDTQRESYLRELSEKQKGQKKNKKIALISGVALLALALLIFICGRISHSIKYSANHIDLTLVNTEDVQEPITKLDIQIINGCKEDLSGLDMKMRFYDSDKVLIAATTLDFAGYMASKAEQIMTINLNDDVVEALCYYSFEEVEITMAINCVRFNNFHREELGEGRERALKQAQKPDDTKNKVIEQKLNDAFRIFDEADVNDGDFEEQAMEFATALDDIWEDVARNKTLLETMYTKAEDYQAEAEYEKAYYVFSLLATVGYEDSEDRAYECAMQVSY